MVLVSLVVLACRTPTPETTVPASTANRDPFRDVFTLDQPLLVDDAREIVLDTREFELPADAKQGAGDWYIVDGTVQVELAAPISHAVNYVSILTDGFAAAQIEFRTEEIGRRLRVQWSTYELFSGSASGVVLGRSVTLRFRNYLQVAGIRPGTNALSLQLEQSAGVLVRSAHLLPGSRIARRRVGPPHLEVEAAVVPSRVSVGENITLTFDINNRGWPARDVGVTVDVSRPGLMTMSAPSRLIGWVYRAKGRMHYAALAPGRYVITLRISGKTGGGEIKKFVVFVSDPTENTY